MLKTNQAIKPRRQGRRRFEVNRRHLVLGAATTASLLAAGYTALAYASALKTAKRRVSRHSKLIATSFGQLEYAVAGSGPPFMMIHGSGGGFDQALAFSEGIMARGHRVIAPSRFGYLRSESPADPAPENQADALAELLDQLAIARLPVAGGSARALCAMQFALRHPQRCSGLILIVPAAYVPGRAASKQDDVIRFVVENVLSSDFIFWSAIKLMPRQLIGTILATDPKLLSQVSPAERRRAYRILENILPVSRRTQGLLNDTRLPQPIDLFPVSVPTLIISAEDDRYGTAAAARHCASQIKGAKLIIYPTGGHIWLGHDEDVTNEMSGFLSDLRQNT